MTSYIKNTPAFWILMIFAVAVCGVISYYHWNLLVMVVYVKYTAVTMRTLAYIAALYTLFPIGIWIGSKRTGKQFSKATRVKQQAQQGQGNFWSAFKAAWGIKPKESARKTVKKARPAGKHYYRFPLLIILIGTVIAMMVLQFFILERTIDWGSNRRFLEVFLWDITFSGGNAGAISALAFLAYKTKSRQIPKNYAPK